MEKSLVNECNDCKNFEYCTIKCSKGHDTSSNKPCEDFEYKFRVYRGNKNEI